MRLFNFYDCLVLSLSDLSIIQAITKSQFSDVSIQIICFLHMGSWVVPYKIMRLAIQSGELLWRSQFWMNFIETLHTCAKNCFQMTALLSSPLQSVLQEFVQILKRKNSKKKKTKRQKVLE